MTNSIRILGTESLGVRGLSCVVKTADRKIVIDPGISLGYRRFGLLPHPVQIGVGEIIRRRIVDELRDATDVVFSHFHGDHIPLVDANPFQMHTDRVIDLFSGKRIWAKGPRGQSGKMQQRACSLVFALNVDLPNAEGRNDGTLSFSRSVPHGERGSHLGEVMMTRVDLEDFIFVHASDIQCLDEETITDLLKLHPDMVFASGPPIYLHDIMRYRERAAWKNSIRLAKAVHTLILDHHLMRCREGRKWLCRLSEESANTVMCAADYMKIPHHLLEAGRASLYREMPVPEGWHEAYAGGMVSTKEYMEQARRRYEWFAY